MKVKISHCTVLVQLEGGKKVERACENCATGLARHLLNKGCKLQRKHECYGLQRYSSIKMAIECAGCLEIDGLYILQSEVACPGEVHYGCKDQSCNNGKEFVHHVPGMAARMKKFKPGMIVTVKQQCGACWGNCNHIGKQGKIMNPDEETKVTRAKIKEHFPGKVPVRWSADSWCNINPDNLHIVSAAKDEDTCYTDEAKPVVKKPLKVPLKMKSPSFPEMIERAKKAQHRAEKAEHKLVENKAIIETLEMELKDAREDDTKSKATIEELGKIIDDNSVLIEELSKGKNTEKKDMERKPEPEKIIPAFCPNCGTKLEIQ